MGGLLVASGLTTPLAFSDAPVLMDGDVDANAWFEEWTYTGAARVDAAAAALRVDGPHTAHVTGNVTVAFHDLVEYELRTHPDLLGGLYASYRGAVHKKPLVETYLDARIHVTGEDNGVLAAWSRASRSPAHFTLALADATNATVRPSDKSATWTMAPDEPFEFELDAPLFALGHGSPPRDHPGRMDEGFRAFEASGDIHVVVGGDAILTIAHAGGEVVARTWARSGVGTDAGPAGFSAGSDNRYAVITLHDATVTMGFEHAESAEFVTRTAEWSVNGTLAFMAEKGTLTAGGQDHPLNGDHVVVRGNSTLLAEAEGVGNAAQRIGGPDVPSVNTPGIMPLSESGIQAGLESDADEVSVNGASVYLAPDLPAPKEVTFLAKLVGAALLAWGIGRLLFLLVLAALRDDPLAHPRRRSVHAFLQEAGIAHLRGIERATGIPQASLSHHLEVLRKGGIVQCVRHGTRRAFFVPSARWTRDDMERFALLVAPTRRRIADALAREGALSQADLEERLRLSQPAVSQQLLHLVEGGLVERRGTWNAKYHLSPMLREWFSSLAPGLDQDDARSRGSHPAST